MNTWERLKCDGCGTLTFVKATYLKWHPTSGMAEETGGWICSNCGKTVDTAKLIHKAKMEQKKQEIKELEEEIKM